MKSLDKHNRHSIRLKHYDYAEPGDYFITICTQNRECLFGYIENEIMNLNIIGRIAREYWEQIPRHFGNILLDEFVVMPNHMHGIITILGDNDCRDTACRVPTYERFGKPIPGSIPTVIRSYKSVVKKWANENGFDHFEWQGRFYEHIIRNEKSLNNIRDYIINNPVMWDLDRNNPQNFTNK